MKTAFVIFDGLTTLDFVGVYDPVTRLKTMDFIPGMEWEICAFTKEVRDDKGLGLQPTRVGQSLGGFDLLQGFDELGLGQPAQGLQCIVGGHPGLVLVRGEVLGEREPLNQQAFKVCHRHREGVGEGDGFDRLGGHRLPRAAGLGVVWSAFCGGF